uniref:Uncharacterized protein n=1 Tax=Anguilla anguilla TaxID=7936 RepID=A0A0E9RWL4_ANGAN
MTCNMLFFLNFTCYFPKLPSQFLMMFIYTQLNHGNHRQLNLFFLPAQTAMMLKFMPNQHEYC